MAKLARWRYFISKKKTVMSETDSKKQESARRSDYRRGLSIPAEYYLPTPEERRAEEERLANRTPEEKERDARKLAEARADFQRRKENGTLPR